MEDGLLGDESLVHPMNLTPKGGSKEVDDFEEEDDKRDHEAKQGEERPSGFINHIFSNLVSGGEDQEEKAGEKHDEEKGGIVSEGADHEDKGGGLISHLISNLVSPLSPKARKVTEQKVEAFEVDNGGSKAEEDAGSDGNGGGLQQGKTGKEGGGGGGIIEKLVSHLPASLQDDAGPTPDEASILIHSIIHD